MQWQHSKGTRVRVAQWDRSSFFAILELQNLIMCDEHFRPDILKFSKEKPISKIAHWKRWHKSLVMFYICKEIIRSHLKANLKITKFANNKAKESIH